MHPREFRNLLASEKTFGLAVICHSAPEDVRPLLHEEARAAGVPVYQLSWVLLPDELIREITGLLGESLEFHSQRARAAS